MEEKNINNGTPINNIGDTNLTNVNPSIEPALESMNFQTEVNTQLEPIQNNEIVAPVAPIPMAQPLEENATVQNVEVSSEGNQPQVVNEDNEVKTSGTAAESELFIDAVNPEVEVIDEYVIKRNVVSEEKRYKKNWIFIFIIIILIVLFIVALPFITKWIGF